MLRCRHSRLFTMKSEHCKRVERQRKKKNRNSSFSFPLSIMKLHLLSFVSIECLRERSTWLEWKMVRSITEQFAFQFNLFVVRTKWLAIARLQMHFQRGYVHLDQQTKQMHKSWMISNEFIKKKIFDLSAAFFILFWLCIEMNCSASKRTHQQDIQPTNKCKWKPK